MQVQEVILRAIDGRVKPGPGRRDPRDFGRRQSVHSADSTDQSETSTESTPRVFNKSIRIARIYPSYVTGHHFSNLGMQLL